MQIKGHGVDIVLVSSMSTILATDALQDWFSEAELAAAPSVADQRIDYLAGRIAAKEAVVKALGTGLIGEMTWTEIAVVSDNSGRPELLLYGTAKEIAEDRGITGWFLSISHTDIYATASVIAVGS